MSDQHAQRSDGDVSPALEAAVETARTILRRYAAELGWSPTLAEVAAEELAPAVVRAFLAVLLREVNR